MWLLSLVRFICTLLFLVPASCIRNSSQPVQNRDTRKPSTLAQIELRRSLEIEDHEKAKVTLKNNGSINLQQSVVITNSKLPTIELELEDADYVKVLRCAASYKMTTVTGALIENITYKSSNLPNRLRNQWAWDSAIRDNRFCTIVGNKIAMHRFEDLAAAKGHWYYILNPCTYNTNELIYSDTCSYNLVKSQVFENPNASYTEQFRALSLELNEAEGRLWAAINKVKFLARKYLLNLEACENMVAWDKEKLKFKSSIIKLAFFVTAAFIASPMGPNMAIMAGQLSSEIAGPLFTSEVLKLPPDIQNECIDPEAKAVSKEDRDKAGTNRYVGKYEDLYGLAQIGKELDTLLRGSEDEPSTIDLHSEEVGALLSKMNEFGLNVIKMNDTLKLMANQGVSIDSLQTYEIPAYYEKDIEAGE